MLKHEDNAVAPLNGNNLQPLAGISVTVTEKATGLPAYLYADDGVTPLVQPLITDNKGYYGFKAPDGTYLVTFSGQRIETFSREIVLDDPKDNPYVTVAGLAAGTGAAGVGNNGETVADSLNALQLADYTALRAYAGPRKSVYITGYLASSAPSGTAGMFVRDDSDTTTADNGGTVIVASNGKRWKRRYDNEISVQWFGAVGDGIANDTTAVLAAINFVKPLTYKPSVLFPAGAYRLTSTLPIFTGLTLIGAGPSDEYGKGTLVFNSTTNLIDFDEKVIGMKLVGITFRGALDCTTKFINNPADPTHSIYWSKIYDCGFTYFNKTTVTLTGTRVAGCFFNNFLYGGFEFKGADNFIVENFFGSDVTAASTYSTVYLSTFSNSRFERNYITGWKTIPLNMTSCTETFIRGNWIDESDLSGIYMASCKGISVFGNRFKNLVKAAAGVHIAGLTIFDSTQVKVIDNTFAGIISSLYLVSVRNSSATSDSIQFIGNVSTDGVTAKYFFDDAVTNITINDPVLPMQVTMNGTVSPRREDGIRGRIYGNTSAATVNSFLLLPKALPGMAFTAIRGSATYSLRVDPQATEKFRGLATGATRTLASEGATLRIQCNETGVWDILGTTGTIS